VPEAIAIRRAEQADVARVAALGAELVRMHHAADPRRFLSAGDVEKGYARYLLREVGRREAVVLVACRGAAVIGYAYGSLEDRDWYRLLDAHGAIHDVFVEEHSRRSGAGRALVSGMVAALEGLGAPRIVLSTRVDNGAAQRLFEACGFRPTMIEMTR
jgi:ribosomal protein S18 acetylase RimI-like enzyme